MKIYVISLISRNWEDDETFIDYQEIGADEEVCKLLIVEKVNKAMHERFDGDGDDWENVTVDDIGNDEIPYFRMSWDSRSYDI